MFRAVVSFAPVFACLVAMSGCENDVLPVNNDSHQHDATPGAQGADFGNWVQDSSNIEVTTFALNASRAQSDLLAESLGVAGIVLTDNLGTNAEDQAYTFGLETMSDLLEGCFRSNATDGQFTIPLRFAFTLMLY